MKKLSTFLFIVSFINNSFSQFTIFNTGNSGLSNNNCWYVNVDANNNIWTSTTAGGLNKYTGAAWTTYSTGNSGIGANYITNVIFDNNGNTWAGSYSGSGGLSKLTVGGLWTLYTTSNSGIAHNDILGLVFDQSGNLWVGTRYNGVCKFNGTNWTIYNTGNSSIPSNTIYSMEADPAGNVWVGTALNGLAKFNGTNWTTYNTGNSLIPNNSIYSLKFNTSTNNLWVGTNGGLAILDPVTNSISAVYTTSNSGLAGNYVRGISFIGNNNSIAWIATGASGICKYDGTNWTTFNIGNSNLPSNQVWSIKAAPNGDVWAATNGAGVVKLSAPVSPDGPTSIFENNFEAKEIFVYPNPNKGTFIFEYNYSDSPKLIVTNILGQIVHEQILQTGKNSINSNFIAGCYNYKVQTNTTLLTGKIIVE